MQKTIAIVILIWAFGNLAYSQEPLTEWQEILLVNRDSETHNFNSYAESIRWARSNEVFDIIDSCETGTVMYVPPNETNSWGWDFIDDGQAPHAPGGVFAYGLYRIEVIDEDQELYVDFRDARYNRDNISLDDFVKGHLKCSRCGQLKMYYAYRKALRWRILSTS